MMSFLCLLSHPISSEMKSEETDGGAECGLGRCAVVSIRIEVFVVLMERQSRRHCIWPNQIVKNVC